MRHTSNAISTDGHTHSIWQDQVEMPQFAPLTQDASTEVCVVGGGIAGLTAAYLLLKESNEVIVLDDSAIGDGQTGRTSAHLASAVDDRFFEIQRMHGPDAMRIVYASHQAAIEMIERICKKEEIDCDFARVDGYLFASPDDDTQYLRQEFEAAREAGAEVEWLAALPLPQLSEGPAIRFARQARFHPLKYLAGLCGAIQKMGGVIHTGNHVNDVQGARTENGERCEVTCDSGVNVRSSAVVVATNTPAPINDWMGIYTKQASYRSYVMGFQIPRQSVLDALFWDTGEKNKGRHLRPYHYIRVDRLNEEHDLLIVGGEDHKVGQFDQSSAPFGALETWTRRHFPQAGEAVARWSGQVQEPADGVAYIGAAPTAKPNVYVITGDSGMGLTHATLGAMLVRDQIGGRANGWEKLYDPSRKATGALRDFVKENVNAAATLGQYVTPGEVASEEDILPGEGALLREGVRKVAVYRDDAGTVHRLSSVCPHLGCIVQWNPVEKSWDCPCHGSRFSAEGQVVMGPAISGLKNLD